MPTYIDQMGRTIELPHTQPPTKGNASAHLPIAPSPHRLISLVPSQTELLIDLGANVVGRTKFCVYPAEQVAEIPVIGGTKHFRFKAIDALQPDLIVGNKEENYKEGIERLAEKYPVWLSDIYTLDDACTMIDLVGEIVGQPAAARRMSTAIADGFAALEQPARPLRVGYFIWQKPLMTVGRETFIHDVLTRCGLINAFAETGSRRYPEVTPEAVAAAELDLIFLSTEPYPFGEKERQAFGEAYPGTAVYLVNGEMFSWYGSRLGLAVEYLNQLVAHILNQP
ncbi:MAG: helical backbone metal receptor [Chloroflexota bacterium]